MAYHCHLILSFRFKTKLPDVGSSAVMPGVVTCTYNPVTLEHEFRNGVGSIPIGGNGPSIRGWIM